MRIQKLPSRGGLEVHSNSVSFKKEDGAKRPAPELHTGKDFGID